MYCCVYMYMHTYVYKVYIYTHMYIYRIDILIDLAGELEQ